MSAHWITQQMGGTVGLTWWMVAIGVTLTAGVFVLSLCKAAGDADRWWEEMREREAYEREQERGREV